MRSKTLLSYQCWAGLRNATNPKSIPRPMRVNAVGKPIMIATTMSPSIRSPREGSLTRARSLPVGRVVDGRALACRLVDGMGLPDGGAPRLLVDELAVRELLADDVDLLDVLDARGPHARAQAHDAARDLRDALE